MYFQLLYRCNYLQMNMIKCLHNCMMKAYFHGQKLIRKDSVQLVQLNL